MPQGLSVSRIVNVDVSFAPQAAPTANFDTLLIMGDSDVVDTGEALRSYNELTSVAGEPASFGMDNSLSLSLERLVQPHKSLI
jgi:hypothetical protein